MCVTAHVRNMGGQAMYPNREHMRLYIYMRIDTASVVHVSEQRVGPLMEGSGTNVSEGYSIVV